MNTVSAPGAAVMHIALQVAASRMERGKGVEGGPISNREGNASRL
ncbi:hypothetical protein [Usitatibacter palustris]|nr:hypothetical protein [Usitatibacter palustris]